VDQVNAAMAAAQTESFGYNTEEIVSSDVIGMKYGSLFDATQTMCTPTGDGNTFGMITKTLIQARWFVQSNTSLN